MITIKKLKTTTVEVDSQDFKIVVKKMIFWQRENGYFKDLWDHQINGMLV